MNNLEKLVLGDIEAQQEGGDEAVDFYHNLQHPVHKAYWDGYRERGDAIISTLKRHKLATLLDGVSGKYIRQLEADNKRLREVSRDLRKQITERYINAEVDAAYYRVRYHLSQGAKIVRYRSGNKCTCRMNVNCTAIPVSPAVIDRLTEEGIEFHIYGHQMELVA